MRVKTPSRGMAVQWHLIGFWESTLLYLLKGRIPEMKQFSAPVPEEHFHLFIVHEFGDDALAKSWMVYPVTRPQL